MGTATEMRITAERVAATERMIRPYVRKTPILEVSGSEFGLQCDRLLFKLELCQFAGCFKVRGAFSNLLSRTIPPAGVVAASGGNHGFAVAFAARQLGMPAAIFVPTVASPIKIANIRSCGAKLVIEGDRYADALAASRSWSAKSGALELHAYDSVETLLGQGTLGLELHQQAPELDTLLVAVGGGGLIGGVAAYYSELIAQGRVRIIGVEPELAPTLTYALRSGHPIDSPAGGIAADSLAPKRVGELMFPIAQRSVNSVILVSDDDIRQAQQILWDSVRLVVEPGGAAAFAVLTSGKYVPAYAERIAVILCGGNTNAVNFEPQSNS
jgi:threonine dehydratase